MGKSKRKFIDNKKATVYRVVYDNYGDGEETNAGAASISFEPVRWGRHAKVEDLNTMKMHNAADDDDDDADNADLDEHTLVTQDDVDALRAVVEDNGFYSRDYDEQGLLVDGYDYSVHLKTIGDNPSSMFVSADGTVLGAKEVAVQKSSAVEEAVHFDVLLPSGDVDADDDVLEAMDALDDDTADPDQLWGGPLDDDFILRATAGADYKTTIQIAHDTLDQYSESYSEHAHDHHHHPHHPSAQHKHVTWNDHGGSEIDGASEARSVKPFEYPASHQQTLMDQRFEALLKEYDDDEIGELDELKAQPQRGLNLSDVREVLDEFMATGPFGIYKDPNHYTHLANKYTKNEDENPYLMLDQLRREARDQGLADTVTPINETPEETDAAIAKLLARPEKTRWDCETIVTTYSNLENHPKYITEPKDIKIKLNPRTGLPITAKPQENEQTQNKDDTAVVSDSASDSGSDTTEVMLVPNVRDKCETTDEKRARKKAVKDAKKLRREQKKTVKTMFRDEKQKQVHSTFNSKKGITQIKL